MSKKSKLPEATMEQVAAKTIDGVSNRNETTPGPWEAVQTNRGWHVLASHVADGGEGYIMDMTPNGRGIHNAEANARLIAAAPALRDALDALVSIREELRLAEGQAPGRVLYVERLYREARAALASID